MKKIVANQKSISQSPDGSDYWQRPAVKFRWRCAERETKEVFMPALSFRFFGEKNEIQEF